MMTTPTDGEWMSAYEALQFLQLPQTDATKAICDRAQVGLIQARAESCLSLRARNKVMLSPTRLLVAKEGRGSAHRQLVGW